MANAFVGGITAQKALTACANYRLGRSGLFEE